MQCRLTAKFVWLCWYGSTITRTAIFRYMSVYDRIANTMQLVCEHPSDIGCVISDYANRVYRWLIILICEQICSWWKRSPDNTQNNPYNIRKSKFGIYSIRILPSEYRKKQKGKRYTNCEHNIIYYFEERNIPNNTLIFAQIRLRII